MNRHARTPTEARPLAAATWTACLALVLCAGPARADIATALTPSANPVAPDSTFELAFGVSSPGTTFDAFTAVVSFDPAALTFVPAGSLPDQLGCLMNGDCSGACGATFHRFTAAGDSLVANVALLCDSVEVAGPGSLYRFRFRAAHTPVSTTPHLRRAVFYRAGRIVGPVTCAETTIDIRPVTAVGSGPGAAPEFALAAVRPNPARGGPFSATFTLPGAAPARLELLDVAGRRLDAADAGALGAGTHTLELGRGRALAPGLYLVRLVQGGATRTARVSVVR